MTVPKVVSKLVDRFHTNRDVYTGRKFKEARLRIEFLDPFLEEGLGWDVNNRSDQPEAYREVIYEDDVRVGGGLRAPDYGFYLQGQRRFFLEAKRPSVDIRHDVDPALQLRRYAWSAKLPLSILTDFEEFGLYDCRIEPKKSDTPDVARLSYFGYEEYTDRDIWEKISEVFSRDAVLAGSLEKYAATLKQRRGTETVDEAFLKRVEKWRAALAQDLYSRNSLDQRQLNYAVQMTIDRIVFLRIAEDRGSEPYERLRDLVEQPGVYGRLMQVFREADERYNSGLFHFRYERGRDESPDSLTPEVTISDGILREIIQNLYYPESPYEFRVLPLDILGQVYEQFLGKEINVSGETVTVEDKPEVRKAGGVYYTPSYIVDHIVKNTVGKLLEGKKPGPRGGVSNLKIVDPACGSGSFLIGAYTYLLDWHRDQYLKDGPHKWKRQMYEGKGDAWHLTIQEKKRILLNNIYGVDIDPQAVEVTKLSLLLKVLEGENRDSLDNQLSLFNERALPDLDANIKCGNSLIESSFYDARDFALFSEDDHYRINVFDWKKEFSQVFGAGGFDAVIGNPPYIRIQQLKEFAPLEVDHYKEAYRSAAKGNYDAYVVFVEKGLDLLNESGRLGYILPHKFFNAKYGEPLREVISSGHHLSEIVHFGDQQVFQGATTYTALLFLDRSPRDEFRFVKVGDLAEWRVAGESIEGAVPGTAATSGDWNFVVGAGAALFERLRQMPVKLDEVTDRIFQGIKTSADKIYIVEEVERTADRIKVYSREKEAEYWLEPGLLHPLIKGGDSKPYRLSRTKRLILFPYASLNGHTTAIIPQSIMKNSYPLIWDYLLDNKQYLEDRERGKMRGEKWYGYVYPKALDVMPLPKLFTPDIAARTSFSLDETGDAFFTGGVSGGYGVLVKAEHSREYVLGLLNSRLLEWFIRQVATQMRGGYYSFESRFIRNLPIHTMDFDNPEDAARHERMIRLVDQMLSLNERRVEAKLGQERNVIQRQIEATDRQIDQLVYELYELTDEEVEIVESETR